ncbi:MAG: phage major capsid protein [Methylocella sp.]
MAEGTGSAGGFLVPSLIFPQLVDRLRFYSSVATVARVIETDSGAALGVLTTDDTANPGTLLAEVATAPASDFCFGLYTLNAYKFTSGIVPVSFEMLQDAALDLSSMILDLFGKRLGRGQNIYFTTGTGTAQPQGVVTGASAGFVLPVGNTSALTYAGLVQLYQSVDPAYRSSPACVWQTNDNTLLAVKSLADTSARPLWLPDVLPQPPGSPFHGTLLGKPVVVNNDMANMAANAKPVIFGDFSQYAIRMMRGAAMMRLDDSAYASKGQVAFIMFSRADGRVLMPQAIRYLQNSAT